MIKKTYVVISFLAFCLIATLFIATVTSGKKDNPWDVISELQTKVDSLNTSLLELRERVSTIEAEANQVKTIRFYDPSEYIVDEISVWINASTFEWTPSNSTNNVVLQICSYAEAKGTIGLPYNKLEAWFCISVHTANLTYYTRYIHLHSEADLDRWTGTETIRTPDYAWIVPNQANYAFQVHITVGSGIAYFKNINIIITVADGLPASNP